jgi:hypothetical protein
MTAVGPCLLKRRIPDPAMGLVAGEFNQVAPAWHSAGVSASPNATRTSLTGLERALA